jgi:hypothetical protein
MLRDSFTQSFIIHGRVDERSCLFKAQDTTSKEDLVSLPVYEVEQSEKDQESLIKESSISICSENDRGSKFRTLLVYEIKWIWGGITVLVKIILAARLHLLRESH